ncbi:M15 family metallopeptidase [Salinibacterium soli]|uniref:M15 family metallopeptidase n=1 Tax=Antiquaquibacter soli TaxID=3064523 RepID=A0ABT9BIB6_9MICO|nr:M15 family metallopeptidase [Protaetiibacter sp. WY-16]MDO7880771.1 M15 family metallopeptidase [Protaetiibacter sp. WY-16]
MSTELRPRTRPSRAVRRRRALVIAGVALVVVVGLSVAVVALLQPSPPAPMPTPTPSRTPSATPTPTPTPTPVAAGFDKTAQSIDDPASYWVVVNKQRPLMIPDYEAVDLVAVPVPYINEPYLRQAASDAVVQMFAAITAETGLQLQAQSAYRSYSTQVSVYQGWVDSLGQEGADLTSARPGHSEHQTGLAIDVNALPDQGCALEPCWGATPHAQWIAANAYRFGFIVRYPDGKTPITGYEYEPYHLRYVGVELATEMHNTGVTTLEEFFGLPPAPTY